MVSDLHRINELIDHLSKTTNHEMPNLMQLRRNLQSPFFNSIRNVYEYVYEQNSATDGQQIGETPPEVQ